MSFVPVSLLLQKEKVASTPADVVGILDRWVLPHYPNHTTNNVLITKSECMTVLMSFQAARKLHYKLTPDEIDLAVNAFLEDRLWAQALEVEVSHDLKPESWVVKVSMLRCLSAIPKVLYEALTLSVSLVALGIGHTYHSIMPRKSFKLPNVSLPDGGRADDKDS